MKVRVDSRAVQELLKRDRKLAEQVIDRAYDYFVHITPYRTGNARNNTHILGDKKTILADYPYAQRLDTGWSSQAKKGMSGPTIDRLEQWVDQELRKMKNG